jgi:hypothetical protein
MYAVDGTFDGALWTSQTCPPSTGSICSAFAIGLPASNTRPLPAGTNYIIVDKSSGANSTFDVNLQ